MVLLPEIQQNFGLSAVAIGGLLASREMSSGIIRLPAGIVADMPAFGNVTTESGGVAGSLAGTITSAGVMTLTAGGAGTSATGQFVSEISGD